MPFDFPKPLTNNAREDIVMLWETLFKTVEQLRLDEEDRARKEQANESTKA